MVPALENGEIYSSDIRGDFGSGYCENAYMCDVMLTDAVFFHNNKKKIKYIWRNLK